MKKEYDLRYRATRTTMFQIVAAEFLASIVFSGALDRFPQFKFVLGEAGVSWLPYILERMDEEYEDRYYQLNVSTGKSLVPAHTTGTFTEPAVAFTVPCAETAFDHTGNCISVRSLTSRTPASMINPTTP